MIIELGGDVHIWHLPASMSQLQPAANCTEFLSVCGMKEPINDWMNKLCDSRARTNMIKGTEIWECIFLSINKKFCEMYEEEREWMGSWAGSRMPRSGSGSDFNQMVVGHHQSFWREGIQWLDLYFRCAFSHDSIKPPLLALKYEEHKYEWFNPYKNFNMQNS